MTPSFVVAATVTLALGLLIQTVVLTAYLAIWRSTGAVRRSFAPGGRRCLPASSAPSPRRCGTWPLRWRRAAKVRTLALVEILFAQILSRNLFKQNLASREAVGIGLIMLGVVILLNQ